MNGDHEGMTQDLRHHYLFAALIDAQYASHLLRERGRSFVAGQLLISQRDKAEALFLVRQEVVNLYPVSPEA